ncbi:ABC transporter permease [Roseisolibacter agri]|uniref:ABC transporter permease n=1 Tax=Roseisolibacter agri TaxID=2014610 RepID=UPI0024E062B2|nr:ABC transporter permease [Roseisolibacter agri]
MLTQLRSILRGLRRAPGFTAAAILCIALGIGANTAIFSAVRAVLLHPVATPDVDRVVAIRQDLLPIKLLDVELAPTEVLDLAERRELFQAVASYTGRGFVLEQGGTSTRFDGVRTLGDYFAMFRVRPYLGRLYTADDSRDGRHQVAVLTYGLWREQFGGDSSVVGRTVRLNDAAHEIVGVLPPDFKYPRQARILVPERMDSAYRERMRGRLNMTTFARLRDGVTLQQAQAGLQATMAAWRARGGAEDGGYGVAGNHRMYVTPFVAFDAGQLRPILLVLLGAVGLVLLIACANVASLQLVRATARTRELAVHAALGAERGRIARRLLGESALLAAAGGMLGVAIGWATTRLLVALAPAEQLALRELRLDGPVLLATALVTVTAALLSGTLPALRGARVDLRGMLQEGMRGGTGGIERHRALRGAVVGQVALSFVLLLASGVMLRSLSQLLAVDPGFRPARITTAAITLPFARYAKTDAAIRFYADLTERLRATPGVEAVSVTTALPLRDGSGNSSPFTILGRDTTGQGEPPHANIVAVDAHYFRTMGIPLLRGRTFEPQDDARPADGTMTFIIDEELARKYFPNEDPIGKRINQGPDGVIVGVVGSVRQAGLGAPQKASVYYNYRQGWWSNLTVVARTTLADEAAARTIRDAVRALDPQVPTYDVAAMPEVVSRSLGTRRFGVVVLGGFALVAVLLAVLGVYGVLSYVVAQRVRELGIRAALGADQLRVATLVLGQGARLVGAGLALGALGYVALGQSLQSLVFGVGPRDPVTLLIGGTLLAGAALLASWLPARRAARIDPATALRAD